MKNLKTIRRC